MRRALRNLAFHQEGQYLLWAAIALPLFLVLLGLIIDGGFMFVSYHVARKAMNAAAQAAAQEVERGRYVATGELALSPHAFPVAVEYARANSYGIAHPTRVTIWARRVRVEGYAELPTVFMRLFGKSSVRVRMVSHARPAFGATEELPGP